MIPTHTAIRFALALLTLAGAASASDTFNFTVRPGAKFNTTVDATAALSGVLRGDYDETSNPAGTITRTGSDFFFGSCSGSTNTSFPFTASGNVPSTAAATNPSGTFTLAVDAEALQGTLTNVSLDLLNGAHPTFPVNASFTNPQNFRTCNPRALWAAATLPLDLGDATLDALSVLQTATPAHGTLTVIGINQYTFSADVEVTVSASLTFNGQSLTSKPTTATIPLSFQFIVTGDTAATQINIDTTVTQSTTDPVPGPVDQPLAIPTIIPPGSVANFLISTTLTSSTIHFGVHGQGTAEGTKVGGGSSADWNHDGVVNSTDVSDFINDWFADQVAGTTVTDFNGDGVSNSTDVSDFINAWFEEV